jgi:predicted site-specific integrase-resolvase
VDLVNRQKLMEILEISKSTLHRWIDEGKLPQPIQPGGDGGVQYFKMEEVEEFLEQHRRKSN